MTPSWWAGEFFARYDPAAEWFDDLRPALGSWFPGLPDPAAQQPSRVYAR